MDFRRSDLAHGHELEGLVVVVDVLRAFSTSAYAFAAGARAVVVAHSLDEIEPLKQLHEPAITVGAQPGGFAICFGSSKTDCTPQGHCSFQFGRACKGTRGELRL